MSWIRGLGQRLRIMLRFSRVESELEHELRTHMDMEVQAQRRAGVPLDEARRRVALRVGNLDVLKEEVRDERGGRLLMDALGDLRIGWRGLRRNPGFTLAVVLSLALGAGGTTAIFSVVHAVLLRPLPYPDSDRLHEVRVWWNDFGANLSDADFLRMREQRGGIADVGAFNFPTDGFTMQTGGGPEVIQGALVTAELPRVLGISPVLGRLPSTERDAREALIGTELWRQRFGGARDALGRGITLDGVAYTIVGVMPPGFNVPGQPDGEVWGTMTINEPRRRGPYWLRAVARLDPGVTAAAAAARLTTAVTPILAERYHIDEKWRYGARPMKDVLIGDVRQTLLLLFGAVSLVLLIAVVNVANLLLARGTARTRELAVRASLGAGRGRLARQLLAESALLGLLGGALGLGMAFVVLRSAGQAAREIVPRMHEVRLDTTVVAFALAIGVIAGVLAGVLPVLRLPWRRLGDTLRDGGRGSGESVRHGRARRALVAAELALTLTVLTGAALLVKSLIRLQTVDPGFRAHRVLSFRLSLPGDPYRDGQRLDAFLTTLDTRLRGLPGVSAVAFTTALPPDRATFSNNYTLEGTVPQSQGSNGVAPWLFVTPDYFTALGIPLMRGRGIATTDVAAAPPVAVVNTAFVRTHLSDGEVIGKRMRGGDWRSQNPWLTIVGVVGDVPYEQGVWGGVSPTVYLPNAQNLGFRSPFVVIKTAGDPASPVSAPLVTASLVAGARAAVLSVDAGVPLRDIATMTERMHQSAAEPRFRSLLFSLLAGLALLLAVTGIYGVMAFHVSQRRRETAIRRALGAQPGRVAAAVIGSAMRVTLAGIIIGFVGAFALTRTLSGVLYDVRPNDPTVFAAAAGALIAAALLACTIPAIRAVRIDPLAILREE